MKGHIRSRGEHTWAVVLDAGRDATGKRHQQWITVHGTKKDAERELARVLHEMNTGLFVEPAKVTVSEYLERWLQDYGESHLQPKTLEEHVKKIRGHIVPALGHIPLAKLQPMHIQRFYNDALRDGRKDGNVGGLSPRTVQHFHRILHEALGQAVKWQLLARNPTDAVEPPRVERKELRVLDEQQTARLLEAAKTTRYHTIVLLAVTAGLRRGEILALRWEDVDWSNGTLAVARSLEETSQGLRFKSPKNGHSRSVALPPLTLDALRAHRVEQVRLKLMMGPAYHDQGLICCRPDGLPWEPNGITRGFQHLLVRADVPRVRFHDLRHGHATHLLRAGVSMKEISQRLGHSGIGITMDTYAHLLPDADREAARRIDLALRFALQESAK